MTKPSKATGSISSPRQFYAAHPWQCRPKKTRSDIEAYVEASGEWETILTVHPTSGASAESGQRFRAGIEGRISVLFRGRGMKRCPAEGRERFELWVATAVLANNLMKIAALLAERSSRRRKAA